MMYLFIKVTTSDLADLETAVKTGQTHGVVHAAHSIKGAAGNLDFKTISDTAQTVELNARQGSLAGAKAAVRDIRNALDALTSPIQPQ
jgi:histidine phosphotransfer protein HptB